MAGSVGVAMVRTIRSASKTAQLMPINPYEPPKEVNEPRTPKRLLDYWWLVTAVIAIMALAVVVLGVFDWLR